MSQSTIAKFINYSPSDSVLIWIRYNLSSTTKTSLRGDLNELSHSAKDNKPPLHIYLHRYNSHKTSLLKL